MAILDSLSLMPDGFATAGFPIRPPLGKVMTAGGNTKSAAGVIADGGFMAHEPEGPRQGRQRICIVIDNQEVCQV
jgi:hypothetical protein